MPELICGSGQFVKRLHNRIDIRDFTDNIIVQGHVLGVFTDISNPLLKKWGTFFMLGIYKLTAALALTLGVQAFSIAQAQAAAHPLTSKSQAQFSVSTDAAHSGVLGYQYSPDVDTTGGTQDAGSR